MAKHEIQINLPGLLKMLGSNIYAEPDVAVREMIQNAHDTCILRREAEPGLAPRIEISAWFILPPIRQRNWLTN